MKIKRLSKDTIKCYQYIETKNSKLEQEATIIIKRLNDLMEKLCTSIGNGSSF